MKHLRLSAEGGGNNVVLKIQKLFSFSFIIRSVSEFRNFIFL